MLAFIQVPVQGIQDHLQVFFVAKKIGIAYIDKNGAGIVLPDIIGISLLDAEQVFIRDSLLIGPVPFPDILLQFTYRRMKINEDIRLDQLHIDDIEQFLLKSELLLR
jgi:hypothetical protein